MQETISIEEFAAHYGKSVQTIQRWARTDRIDPPPAKTGGCYRIFIGSTYISKPRKSQQMESEQQQDMRRRYRKDLPKNLTYRSGRDSFAYRDPITKKEINLGKVHPDDAIDQAIEANQHYRKNEKMPRLLDRIMGTAEITVSEWIKKYKALLDKRELSHHTLRQRTAQLAVIDEAMGPLLMPNVSTKTIAKFINIYVDSGKKSTAATMRSLLNNMFKEAIADGIATNNPVAITRSQTPITQRERLTEASMIAIYEQALKVERVKPWMARSIELALLTGQRREDICTVRVDEVKDMRLWVIQGKTGAKISITTDLSLQLGPYHFVLSEVITRCLSTGPSEYIINSQTRKSGRQSGDPLNPDTLSKTFAKLRQKTALQFTDSPPSFHEIRSLSSRMYKEQYGKEFSQLLLGHKTMRMTDMYLDPRKEEWKNVDIPMK